MIEDIDEQVGFGAHWGEVNSNLHKGLGSVGVITNGSIRDADMWAEGFGALDVFLALLACARVLGAKRSTPSLR